jgi:hypothetical protein
MTRTTIPKEILQAILVKSRRRCCLCFFYENKYDRVPGQVAHIDRNSRNSVEANLAYLCLPCHGEYDSTLKQTKNWQPDELKEAKECLEIFISSELPSLDLLARQENEPPKKAANPISKDVYELRYPIYAAFEAFVIYILREVAVDHQERIKFLNSTSQAYFLFGDEIEEYLRNVHKQSVQLARANWTMAHRPVTDEKWQEACELEMEMLTWFEEQLHHGKRLFGPYLQIAN